MLSATAICYHVITGGSDITSPWFECMRAPNIQGKRVCDLAYGVRMSTERDVP